MTDGQAKPEATPNAGGVTFTQEQQAVIDRIAGERAARERAKYADYDDLKGKLATFEQEKQAREEAAKTEQQKAIDAAVEKTRKEAEAEFAKTEARLKLENAVAIAVGALADPEAAQLFLLAGSKYRVTKPEEVQEKLEALLTDKPHLKAAVQGQKPLGAAGTPASGKTSGTGRITVSSARLKELRDQGKWVGSDEQRAYEKGLLDVVD